MKDSFNSTTETERGMFPRPSLEWTITEKCNYNCPYCCSQGRGTHCPDDVADSVFKLLSELEGSWLVKLVGGEPMIHPRFSEICERAVGSGHKLCMTTNFSLPLAEFKRLIDTCGDRLEYITASLHISQIRSIEDFVKKAAAFDSLKNGATDFVVTSVVTENDFNRLKNIEKRLCNQDVTFRYQIMKIGGKYRYYTHEIENYISNRLINNTRKLRGRNLLGTYCQAGSLFFRINANGEVVRCYSQQPFFHLGNVKSSFTRFKQAKPCLARRCTCTVPVNRNMVYFGNKANAATIAKEYVGGIFKETHHRFRRLKEKK